MAITTHFRVEATQITIVPIIAFVYSEVKGVFFKFSSALNKLREGITSLCLIALTRRHGMTITTRFLIKV